MPVITRTVLKYLKTKSFAHTYDHPDLHKTLEEKIIDTVTFFDAKQEKAKVHHLSTF